MKISHIQQTYRAGEAMVSADVLPDCAQAPLKIWYRLQGLGSPAHELGDALAAGLLPACMFEGENLIIDSPASGTLLRNLARAQEVLTTWYPFLVPVDIAPTSVGDGVADRALGVACCFSAGVDSWYSLLKHQDRVSHLLLVRGFDIGLDNEGLWAETLGRIADVAERMGKRLITCETNLRVLADKRRCGWGKPCGLDFWGQCLHGSALASIGLMLGSEIGELIVPASHSYDRIRPWGSSPLLDSFLSSHSVEIVHDGCEAGRVKKIYSIAASDLALESLRVCYTNSAAYNCGQCEKCIRTLIALRICGARHRAKTFPEHVPLSRVREVVIPESGMKMYEELMQEAWWVNDFELAKAIGVAIGRRSLAPRAYAKVKRLAGENGLSRRVSQWLEGLLPFIPTRRRI